MSQGSPGAHKLSHCGSGDVLKLLRTRLLLPCPHLAVGAGLTLGRGRRHPAQSMLPGWEWALTFLGDTWVRFFWLLSYSDASESAHTHKASPLALTLGSLTTSRNLRRSRYLQGLREYSHIGLVTLVLAGGLVTIGWNWKFTALSFIMIRVLIGAVLLNCESI